MVDPGVPSSSSRATCSESPIAPITVSSSPSITWARAPTLCTRSTTACTSSGVAVGFITIIICGPFYAGNRREALSEACRGREATSRGVPAPDLRAVRAPPRGWGSVAERLAKSPGVQARVGGPTGGGWVLWVVCDRGWSCAAGRGCTRPIAPCQGVVVACGGFGWGRGGRGMQFVTNPGSGFGFVTKLGSSLHLATNPRRPCGFVANSRSIGGKQGNRPRSWAAHSRIPASPARVPSKMD